MINMNPSLPAPLLDSPTELMPLLDRGGRRSGTAGHRGSHLGAVGHGMVAGGCLGEQSSISTNALRFKVDARELRRGSAVQQLKWNTGAQGGPDKCLAARSLLSSTSSENRSKIQIDVEIRKEISH